MKLYTKLDVARSQLDEAIRLYFEKRDPVSIHTLVGAAHQIMRDVASSNGIEYKCIVENMQEKETITKKEWYRAVFQPRNFFKHANQDSNVILDFDPNENEVWLLDACVLYGQVWNSTSKSVDAFWSWYLVKNPEAKQFMSVPTLVQLAGMLNIESTDFRFFLDHCHEIA